MNNANESAYPIISHDGQSFYLGLTKRELFAAMAMQGILAKDGWAERLINEQGNVTLRNQITLSSILMADKMLEGLEL